MAAKKPIDPDTLGTSWSLQRARKPTGKLFPGPRLGPQGDWRVQLFMAGDGCLYERHRTSAYEKAVERWFAITSFEATVGEPPRHFNGATLPHGETKRPKGERAAEKRRQAELELRYSLNMLFADLVDELEFAITEGLWDDEGRRVFRRVIKRVVEARSMLYELGQPQPAPTKPAEYPPPIAVPSTKTIQ